MMTPVYTAIFDDKDRLNENQIRGDFNYFAFLSNPYKSRTWDVKQAEHIFYSDKDNENLYKFSPHLLFPKAKFSLWLDPGYSLHINVNHIISKEMKKTDVLMTKDMSFILRKNSIRVFDFDDYWFERSINYEMNDDTRFDGLSVRVIDPIYHN